MELGLDMEQTRWFCPCRTSQWPIYGGEAGLWPQIYRRLFVKQAVSEGFAGRRWLLTIGSNAYSQANSSTRYVIVNLALHARLAKF